MWMIFLGTTNNTYICLCSKLCHTAFKSIEGARSTMGLERAGVRGEHDTRGLSPPARPKISLNSVAGK